MQLDACCGAAATASRSRQQPGATRRTYAGILAQHSHHAAAHRARPQVLFGPTACRACVATPQQAHSYTSWARGAVALGSAALVSALALVPQDAWPQRVAHTTPVWSLARVTRAHRVSFVGRSIWHSQPSRAPGDPLHSMSSKVPTGVTAQTCTPPPACSRCGGSQPHRQQQQVGVCSRTRLGRSPGHAAALLLPHAGCPAAGAAACTGGTALHTTRSRHSTACVRPTQPASQQPVHSQPQCGTHPQYRLPAAA